MLFLWGMLFIVIALSLGIVAFSGIAIAVSFFTKFLFLVALVCFLVGLILIVIEKMQLRDRTYLSDREYLNK